MNVQRLSVGLLGSGCLLAVGLLAGAGAASAAVPSSVGASWVGQAGSTFGSTGLAQSGSFARYSVAGSVSGLSWPLATSWPQSAPGSRKLASVRALVSPCPPDSWQPPLFSPSLPSSPYPSCDPASYQGEVVRAVVDLRDTLSYGLGLLLLTNGATMVLLMARK